MEVVHEALIREWLTLQEWMNANRQFRVWQERLRSAKGQWEATNQDPGSLLRGAALAEAEEKLKERPEDLIHQKKFIVLSIEERDRLKQVEAVRRKREIRTARRVVAGSLVAVVISTGLGLMAWNETKQAEISEIEALNNSSEALFTAEQPFDALKESLKAVGKLKKAVTTTNDSKIKVIATLQQAVYAVREHNTLEGHSREVYSVAFSPDGKTIASGSKDNTVKLWNLEGKEIKTLEAVEFRR